MASLPRPTLQPETNPDIIKTALKIETIVPVPNKRSTRVHASNMQAVRKTDHREDGVFLTWEDLCVTVSNGKSGTKSILQGLTGFARPGEPLALMGPSGCGKSTLLDALAGNNYMIIK